MKIDVHLSGNPELFPCTLASCYASLGLIIRSLWSLTVVAECSDES